MRTAIFHALRFDYAYAQATVAWRKLEAGGRQKRKLFSTASRVSGGFLRIFLYFYTTASFFLCSQYITRKPFSGR
jgi:hypothetical protein